jgi:hypothetical protein
MWNKYNKNKQSSTITSPHSNNTAYCEILSDQIKISSVAHRQQSYDDVLLGLGTVVGRNNISKKCATFIFRAEVMSWASEGLYRVVEEDVCRKGPIRMK